MSEHPVVFNIQYTSYEPSRSMSETERENHAKERAFYNLTGNENYLKYMTTENKCANKGYSVLDYFQKSTGVFNTKGLISEDELNKMKERAKENKGNIWHGYVSFHEDESNKIDTPEKCIAFVKSTFGKFMEEAHLSKNNMDLICALHIDRPSHLHIHFCMWEKEPKYKRKNGTMGYRSKGKIEQNAIDNFMIRAELYTTSERQALYHTRVEGIATLKGMTYVKSAMKKDDIRKEIVALAKELPKEGRLSYGSKDMEPFRERVDRIVQMLLASDREAKNADDKFYQSLSDYKKRIGCICSKTLLIADNKNLPNGNETVNLKAVALANEIEKDYVRRQGNLVINLAKFIKPEYYESKGKKANSNNVKHYRAVSNRKIKTLVNRFFQSFAENSKWLERDCSHRLQDIEEEIKEEEKRQKQKEEYSKR